jgi:high-affinity Fe2+/Pb2+ permease
MPRKLRLAIGGLTFLAAAAVMGYGFSQTLLITAGYDRDFATGALCGVVGTFLLYVGYWLVDPTGFRESWRDR